MTLFPRIILAVFLILLLTGCPDMGMENGNNRFENFSEAVGLLLEQVYTDHRITFYCGCPFSPNKKVQCKTGTGKRAEFVEWEHVVPASLFGNTFSEWESQQSLACEIPPLIRSILGISCRKLSGRENARQNSRLYRLMECDMYNLVPAIGLINQYRSNHPYGVISGEKRAFGKCDFEVEDGVAEPTPRVRGDIARIYFYMIAAYPGRISITLQEDNMFRKWSKDDPVDHWECKRCKRIEWLQGNENPYVKGPCKDAGMW